MCVEEKIFNAASVTAQHVPQPADAQRQVEVLHG
jgi:hypothetical protein